MLFVLGLIEIYSVTLLAGVPIVVALLSSLLLLLLETRC
jgi:hypothetical protein